ncbi:MAG: FHA domain-containing protein [Deltaproteobacteria bacterium]|jgi:pSer/pThr/pTyr-binding forkhead associated (FHA) protein|nr:FHA domain-containing protein [Deltaproteobacteria bacterium]
MPKHDDWSDEATNPINVSIMPLSLEQQPCALQMIAGPGAPKTFDLFLDEAVVGRAIDADIPINSTDLSRRHMMLKRSGPSQYTVVDLESRNGVYLNGVKVHSAVLHDGDNLQLGTVMFVFHEGRGSTLPTPVP